MTAWGTVDLAVEAMRQGARDFVQKPWDNARLLTTLRTQIALGQALRVGQRLEAENRILRHEGAPVDDRGFPRHAPGAGRHRARRPVGRQRPDHRGERHRQGRSSRGRSTPPPPARRGRS